MLPQIMGELKIPSKPSVGMGVSVAPPVLDGGPVLGGVTDDGFGLLVDAIPSPEADSGRSGIELEESADPEGIGVEDMPEAAEMQDHDIVSVSDQPLEVIDLDVVSFDQNIPVHHIREGEVLGESDQPEPMVHHHDDGGLLSFFRDLPVDPPTDPVIAAYPAWEPQTAAAGYLFQSSSQPYATDFGIRRPVNVITEAASLLPEVEGESVSDTRLLPAATAGSQDADNGPQDILVAKKPELPDKPVAFNVPARESAFPATKDSGSDVAEVVPMYRGADASAQMTVSPRFHSAAVAHAPVHRQLGEAILRIDGSLAEVALSPEELGSVRLMITRESTGLIISLHAERPETLELMRRNADLLQQELSDEGSPAAELRFSLSEQEDGARQQQGNVFAAALPKDDENAFSSGELKPKSPALGPDRIDVRV